jgi:hypothetical protein
MAEDSEEQMQEQSPADDPSSKIESTTGEVQDLLSKAGEVTDTLNEAAAKLESAARTVDAADDSLSGMQSVVLEVTGLEAEIPETPAPPAAAAAPPAADTPAAATPVAAAAAAAAAASGSGPTYYLELTTPLGADKLELIRLEGSEYISDLFHFRLEMKSKDSAIDFTQIVGKSVTISFTLADNTKKRYINGIIARFGHAGSHDEFTYYYADLMPALWKLTLTRDNKIFQEKTVIEIITAVLDEYGISDYKNSTTGTYTAREYCVQYRESAYNFIARLAEEEGIFFFFTHESGKHTLVLADDSSAHKDCEGLEKARFAKTRRSTSAPLHSRERELSLSLQRLPKVSSLPEADFPW